MVRKMWTQMAWVSSFDPEPATPVPVFGQGTGSRKRPSAKRCWRDRTCPGAPAVIPLGGEKRVRSHHLQRRE
jgi:hypothetical protein